MVAESIIAIIITTTMYLEYEVYKINRDFRK